MRRLERHSRNGFVAGLLAPRDAASLGALRLLFGLVMSAAALRFVAKGWLSELILAPSFHFTYPTLGFIRPLPGPLMLALYVMLAIAGLGVALGLFYRTCAIALFAGFSYVELIDRALYLNHYYLVSLLAGLLIFLPAGRVLSLDVALNPRFALSHVPGWVLGALRLQVGLVYFFAGVAKLNADWLLEAQPLRIWLAARADLPLLGPVLAWPATAFVASWLGAAFDLSIVALLSWRPTRAFAFALLVVFHALTAILFPIGIFPWLMTAAATILLAPDWPRRFLARLPRFVAAPSPLRSWLAPRWLVALLALHFMVQVVLPLRRFVESHPSAWTQRGFDFGWNVMVAEKAGHVSFRVHDRDSGEVTAVDPLSVLAPFQEAAMARDPELIRQAALHVADRYRQQGRQVAVFADSFASLNGRPSSRLLDPAVDLTGPLPDSWILPLP